MIEFLVHIEQACRNLIYRCKVSCPKLYLLIHGSEVGRCLKCIKYHSFRLVSNKNQVFCDSVTIVANSLVLKKSIIEPYGIYGGNPLKLLKFRNK